MPNTILNIYVGKTFFAALDIPISKSQYKLIGSVKNFLLNLNSWLLNLGAA
ncbi:hypothetical protein PIROE2DRAFT_14289 [Piromyces sp. E2]|nr:hypothetical protein PIROE2DRAFT_14289 [Piromyces sp. E2]|eukprot:OUM60034.1 hypothetical protein PIROE2DRAFT_14289 [Piromyces sp. E2]